MRFLLLSRLKSRGVPPIATFIAPACILFASIAVSGCGESATAYQCPFCPCEAAARGPLAISPDGRDLNVGDTLTASWSVAFPLCLDPADTVAAKRHWAASPTSVLAIDAITGHATALRPGWADIYLTSDALGIGSVRVYEPPSADTIVTEIRDVTDDSILVTIEDANGVVQRSRTVAARDSACFVTPLSDSVRYSVVIYEPTRTDTSAAEWVVHAALEFTRSWYVFIGNSWNYSTNTLGPRYWELSGYDPDRGC
jgi:hypothetical protein